MKPVWHNRKSDHTDFTLACYQVKFSLEMEPVMYLDKVESDVQQHTHHGRGGAVDAEVEASYPALGTIDADAINLEPEAMALNLEASIRVFKRHQIFNWTQGLLQNLIPHEVLVCVARNGDGEALDIEGFSTSGVEPEPFGSLYRQDQALSSRLMGVWSDKHFQPFVFDLAGGSDLPESGMTKELQRIGATKLLAHGLHDGRGRMTSFFVFACRAEDAGERKLRLVEMLVPSLNAAWMRTQINLAGDKRTGSATTVGRDILTQREQEVLRWVYLGKSNLEIGMILGISPLTVKNHVQEILRRLDVQNRAQAVGKAFKLHILSC